MKKPRSKRVAFGKGKPTEEMKKGWGDSIKVQLDDLMKQVEQYKLENVMASIPTLTLGSASGANYIVPGGANYGGTPNWQYKQNNYTYKPPSPYQIAPPPMPDINWYKTTINYNPGVNFIEEPDKYHSRKFHKSGNGVHFPCE